MNIAIFSDTFPPEINGVSTSVSMLYRVLKEHGHNVFVITTNPYTKHLMQEGDIFRVPGIKLKKFYGYIFARAYSRKVVKFLKDQKIDLVHINHDFSIGQFGWIVQKQLKCASVYTYHTMYEDYTYYATKGKIDRFAKWFVRDYFRNISNRCDELIVPSYKCKDYARRIGINKYINVIPTGIDLDMFLNFKLDINKKNEYLKSINVPADSKIVLYLGRLAEEKNIEVLLDHFKDFLNYSKRDDVYFILVGDGPLRKKYEKYASDLGISNKVRFVGKVLYEDSPFYYSLGDVFVSASVSETQGLTFLEAMASKKILLVKSDINLFELIQNGYNGYFYENSEEFCEKLGKILNFTTTYYSEVVFNALESLNKWGLETFYRKVEVVYNKAIKKVW